MKTETITASSERIPEPLGYLSPIDHQNHVKHEQPENDDDDSCKSAGHFTLQSDAPKHFF